MLAFVEFVLQEKCRKHRLSGKPPVYTPAQKWMYLRGSPRIWTDSASSLTLQSLSLTVRFTPVQCFERQLQRHRYVEHETLWIAVCQWLQRQESSCYWAEVLCTCSGLWVERGCSKDVEQFFSEVLWKVHISNLLTVWNKKYKALFLKAPHKCIYCLSKFAYCVTSYTDKKCDIDSILG